jgi:hypothetical protein
VIRDEDALLNTQCPRNLELRWQTEVSSSIYATPLIADINRYIIIETLTPLLAFAVHSCFSSLEELFDPFML